MRSRQRLAALPQWTSMQSGCGDPGETVEGVETVEVCQNVRIDRATASDKVVHRPQEWDPSDLAAPEGRLRTGCLRPQWRYACGAPRG